MNRLLTLLLIFAFTAVVLAPAPAQDEKKPEVVKEDDTKKDEPKADEPKAAEPKAAETKASTEAKKVPVVVYVEETFMGKLMRMAEKFSPIFFLVMIFGLFVLVLRLRSDLTALQEQVKGG